MKRRRTVLEPEETDDTPIKKRKSRSKRTKTPYLETVVGKKNDLQVFEENAGKNKMHPVVQNSRRKGKTLMPSAEVDALGVNSPLVPGTSSSTEHPQKKKRKAKGDINQNGDIDEETKLPKVSEIPCKPSKKKKKNGLQGREASESPSDFQPLGDLVKKTNTVRNFKTRDMPNEEIKLKTKDISNKKETSKPLKKRRARKGVLELDQKEIKPKEIEQVLIKEMKITEDIDLVDPDTKHEVKVSKREKKLQDLVEPQYEELSKPDSFQKRPKKKVRIDETESLKVKKELADTELHFSVRELPAKIIKSKLNKNLTEEVKVSPLTVQVLKIDNNSPKLEVKEEYLEDYDLGSDIEESEIKVANAHSLNDNATSNSEDSDLEVYYINKTAEKEAKKKDKLVVPKKHSILMPKEDQFILVQRVQDVIPEADTKSYKYQLQKLEWEKVTFKNYSLEECQKVWNQLLKKVRHYRLLTEITHDIKKIIELNDLQVTKPKASKSSNKKHPDMPKRPLTSYFLYYIRKRDQVAKDRPELDTLELNKYISEKYQNLPLEKKQKYEKLAAKNREEYKRQMEEFYGKHPEMRKVVVKKRKEKKQKPPKRPDNPYRLFVQSELSREEIADEDKAEFKEVCREKWRQMSDAKKLGWINLAEEHLQKYEEELKEYMAMHPEYTSYIFCCW